MDRGFCSGPVIRYLEAIKQRAILACTIRGKEGGTRHLCHGRKSYRTRYTFTDATPAEMAVVATLVPNKEKKRRRKWQLFVLIGIDWKPKTIYRRYPGAPGRALASRVLIESCGECGSRRPHAIRLCASSYSVLRCSWSISGPSCAGPSLVSRAVAHIVSTRLSSSFRHLFRCSGALLNISMAPSWLFRCRPHR